MGLSLPKHFNMKDLGQWCGSHFERPRGYATAHAEAERLAQANRPQLSVLDGGAFEGVSNVALLELIVKLDDYVSSRING